MCSQGNSWYIKHPWQSAAFSHHIGPPLSLLLHSSWTVDTTEICPATKWCGSYTYSIKLKLHYSTSPGGHSSPNPADSHRSLKKPNIAFIKRIISMLNLRFLSNFVSGFMIRICFTIENGAAWISIWQISSSSQSLWCITLPMNLAKKGGRNKSRKSWKGKRYNIVDLDFSPLFAKWEKVEGCVKPNIACICIFVFVNLYLYICFCIFLFVYLYLYICTCIFLFVYLYLYTYIYIFVFVYLYLYTYIWKVRKSKRLR